MVDDHQVVIDGIKLMFETEPDIQCVGEARDGRAALELLAENEAEVVLLDINMPIMDGISVCKEIKSRYPNVKVLLLTMLKEASMVKKSLEAGTDGYLLKHEGKTEVLTAIRDVAAGRTYHSEEVTRLVMSSFSVVNKVPPDTLPRISRREKQILKLIVNENTTAEIAAELFVSTHTIESHRKNLLMKLGARNTAGLVRIAMEQNLV